MGFDKDNELNIHTNTFLTIAVQTISLQTKKLEMS